VSLPSFYQWRKKLAAGSAGRNESVRGVEAFAPVRLVGTASVIAWLPGGTRVEIPLGDPRVMQLVLETLARTDAEHAWEPRAERAGGATF
jgi:hypothetical protein